MSDIRHALEDDGLTLVSTWRGPKGTHVTKVTWTTIDEAEKHYDRARYLAEERASGAALTGVEIDQKHTARRIQTSIGTFFLHLNTGPPTWWLPRCKVGLRNAAGAREVDVMVGWMRALVAVSWKP